MLTGEQIKDLGLISGGVESSYQAASYDVRIESLIAAPIGKIEKEYQLPPQGIVEAISKERICLPADVVGIAHVRTSLCNEGVLAINIGIIDPGWNGKISSFLINFANRPKCLEEDQKFLRVCFFRMTGISSLVTTKEIADATYVSTKRQNVLDRFTNSFLDIRVAAEEAFRNYRTRILAGVTAAAFLLALMTFLLNFGNLLIVYRWVTPAVDVRHQESEHMALEARAEQLERANKLLIGKIDDLERQIQNLQKSNLPLGRPPKSP